MNQKSNGDFPTDLICVELRIPTNPEMTDSPLLAASIFVDTAVPGPRTVCFAFPGGGYGRRYFDLQHSELNGPSQAVFHASRGVVFIPCDPYGGGESTLLPPEKCGLEATAQGVDFAIRTAIRGLKEGTIVEGLPPLELEAVFGIGHSLGGMQVVVQQALHKTFDAIAILGFSAIQTRIPLSNVEEAPLAPHANVTDTEDVSLELAWSGPLSDDISYLKYAYHWEDVSPIIVEEDMGVGFPIRTSQTLPSWITTTFPPFAAECMAPGVIANEASEITVPVFVGGGQRDVVPNVHEEALAYRESRDVTLYELPMTAHMHNFSPQRELLWNRLHQWMEGITAIRGKVERSR